MAEYPTVQSLIEILQQYEPTEKVAIPFIWFKDEVEDAFEEKLTDTEWAWLINRYTDNDAFHEESFNVMSDYVAQMIIKRDKNEHF